MHSSAPGAAARMSLRSFWRESRLSALNASRYWSTLFGLAFFMSLAPGVSIPIRRIPAGQPARRLFEIDRLHEHATAAVRQPGLARARRVDEARRRLLEPQSVVDAREIDRVFQCPAHHRLLVERRPALTPGRLGGALALGTRVLGMEYDRGAPHRRP